MNSRGENCDEKRMTTCCPHMPIFNGKYASTNSGKILNYKNKKYRLYTCCKMCAEQMNQLSRSNPTKFSKMYISKRLKNGNLLLKNRHTKKPIQIARLIMKTRKQRKSNRKKTIRRNRV